MSRSPAVTYGSLSRFLYTHNPFYLVSALLVLIGLHKALSADSSLTGGWLLMGMLCGYTLLLVVAGYVIVRFGQVWEDARMILLVIVLLFLALSVSFDRIVLQNPASGTRFLLIGLLFSVLVSECVFRSLKIHLATQYRLSYYLVLALLFTYPMVLGRLSVQGHDIAMAWGVFLFPLSASTILMSLWPAARRTAQDEPPNGTPWSWPWFPWSLFAFLLLAIALRSYSLSMAFEASKGSAVSFRPYFLSPLVLASSVLLLEMAIANGRRRLEWVALVLPASVLLLSFPGSHLNPVATRFLNLLTRSTGSPLQLALAGLAFFYMIAWLRKLPLAEVGLIGCACLACVAGRQTISIETLTDVRTWPLAALALVQLPLGLWRRSYWRTVVGAVAGMAATSASGWLPDSSPPTRYVLIHASVVLFLMAAAVYNDRWTRVLRRVALLFIPVAGLAAATSYEFVFPHIPRADHALYLTALFAIAVLYWRRRMESPELLAMLASAGCLLLFGSRSVYLLLESSPLRKGLPWIAGGLTMLGVALLVSFMKGGLLSRGWSLLRSLNRV
jgi:hypothetical protein